jgi:hypothetical protein
MLARERTQDRADFVITSRSTIAGRSSLNP